MLGGQGQVPILVLKEGTTREHGKDAKRNNINAAKAISDAGRSTLGPRGMDKMLVDSMGDVVISNDGVTILKEIDVEHPAAKMIIEAAKTQDEEWINLKIVRFKQKEGDHNSENRNQANLGKQSLLFLAFTLKYLMILILFLAGLSSLWITGPYAQEKLKKRVLILNSYHSGFDWTDKIMQGIESGFNGSDLTIDFYIEYMDTKRRFDPSCLQQLYYLYQNKFSNFEFDAIISSDDNAFQFLLDHI